MAEKSELYFEDGTIVASTRYAAAYFGVTAATLSNWGKAGCPHFKYGFWDIKAVTAWCAEKDGERLAEAARPGPWRNEVTPYLVGIMDAFDDPEVEDITFVKCTQVGGTSVMLNMIGKAICCDPGPMMMVYPKDDLCELASEEKLQPMIRSCPALREQYDENSKRLDLVFSSSRLALVSANSPSNLASRPVRYLFLDEEDKFPIRAGKEASPAKLAMERQHTFATSRKGAYSSVWEYSGICARCSMR